MSLYDSDIATRDETLAIADYRELLRRRIVSGQSATDSESGNSETPSYRKTAERFVYRPQGYLATDSYRPERRERRDVKVRQANATYQDEMRKRARQNRKAGKR